MILRKGRRTAVRGALVHAKHIDFTWTPEGISTSHRRCLKGLSACRADCAEFLRLARFTTQNYNLLLCVN